uniref:Uncharacterized protein n=1 Tax=Timema cristinae TaxID=61476 RepID=A0A7R9DM11_TIMCR|nr:unnamed protein product [Timema cristinae]
MLNVSTSVAIPQFIKKIQKSLYGTVRLTVPATWCLTVVRMHKRGVGRKAGLPGPTRRTSPPLYTQLTTLANTIPTSCVTISKRTPNMLVLGELFRANKLCWVVLDHLLEIINDQPNMLAESGGSAHALSS